MEQKYGAPPDKVFALLTDPKWLEACSLALGELSASGKARKSGGTVALTMLVEGQPLTMNAEFELLPSGNGSVYRIEHRCESGVPLTGGAVAKFAQGQVEQGCGAEFAYRVDYLKKST